LMGVIAESSFEGGDSGTNKCSPQRTKNFQTPTKIHRAGIPSPISTALPRWFWSDELTAPVLVRWSVFDFRLSSYDGDQTLAPLGDISSGRVRRCGAGHVWLSDLCSLRRVLRIRTVRSQSCEGRCLVSDLAGVLAGICLGNETASSDPLRAASVGGLTRQTVIS
jgi:hypothetical protein